jgi:hypothetical protein
MSTQIAIGTAASGSLSDASVERLACLLRHWTWADEAKAEFDKELADGVDYDDDPMSDRPFGAYYRWGALLYALSEAAISYGLLSATVRVDLDASLPGLRACQQLLMVIPASLEDQPRPVDLLYEGESLRRVRRVHDAIGNALRQEQLTRQVDSLDP